LSGIGLVVLALVAVSLLSWRQRHATADERSQRQAEGTRGVVVHTAPVTRSPASRIVRVIGEARPFAEVTLYAKVSGYVGRMLVDRGDRVRNGQLLATLESPETARALAAARAEYNQKQLTASRVAQLFAQQFVSAQEADQARADADIAHERMAALEEQQSYTQLRAPFDGQVTARFADPGALLQSAASSQSSALPVVTISQSDRLRVSVYLDQADANAVRPGADATVSLDDAASTALPARVSRISGILDPRTRKMLAEIDLDNRAAHLVPGSIVQVALSVPTASHSQAPAEALIVRGGGSYLGVVDSSSHVRLLPVHVLSNDGHMVSFNEQVAPGAKVALSLGGGIADGAAVAVVDSSASSAVSGAKR
jgi:RND family efflux transporter MFP subunit